MTGAAGAPPGHVLDSGPLLCLGGAPRLLQHYKARWAANTAWVEAVRDEMVRHARRDDGVGDAARRYQGTGSRWLGEPAAFSPGDVAVKGVLAEVRRLAAAGGRDGARHAGGKADLGEAQSIVHAGRERMVFLSSDDIARRVSRRCRVRAGTIVDLARVVVADDRSQAKPLSGELLALKRQGIDIGDRVNGHLDLHPSSVDRRMNPQQKP